MQCRHAVFFFVLTSRCQDLIAEAGVTVSPELALGFGRCRLCVIVPQGSLVTCAADCEGLRIATSFPSVTAKYFDELRVNKNWTKPVCISTVSASM